MYLVKEGKWYMSMSCWVKTSLFSESAFRLLFSLSDYKGCIWLSLPSILPPSHPPSPLSSHLPSLPPSRPPSLPPSPLSLLSSLPLPAEWTMEDKVTFEQAFHFHGKNFQRIRAMLPDKPISSLVKYYYLWKKSYSQYSLMDKHARKNSKRIRY